MIPYAYQEIAITKASEINILLADKCGLGKTLVAQEVFLRNNYNSCLFITKKYTKPDLAEQLYKQDQNTKIIVINKPEHLKEIFLYKKYYCIIHYQLIKKLLIETKIKHINFDFIVGDEIHAIKNRKTQVSKALKQLKASHKLGMSATPANRQFNTLINATDFKLLYSPIELWSIFNWLHPKNFSSYWRYYNIFMDTYTDFFGYRKESGIKNVDKYLRLLSQIFLQRTKEDVLPSLPKMTHIRINIELDTAQEKLYHKFKLACKHDIVVDIKELNKQIILNILSMYTRLHQIASCPQLLGSNLIGTKIKWILDFLTGTDDKILIVSRYTKVIEILHNKIGRGKLATGKKFTVEPGTQPDLILGTIKFLAGVYDWHFIDTIIFIDQVYSTIEMEQVRDRIHRMNIISPKKCYYLVAKNTIDIHVFNTFNSQLSEEIFVNKVLDHIRE